jgi:hypothetical protein
MKNAVKITVEQLKEMLLNWNYGAQPVSVQYVVEPDFLNKECKENYANVRKFAHVGGMVGYVYQNSVNNQLEREGKEREFISKPLWNGAGQRINTALSTHKVKGTFYMTFKPHTTYRSMYFDLVDFVAYSNKFMRDFLKPFKAPTNQGVEEGKEIFHREISLENITKLKLKKVTYIIQK